MHPTALLLLLSAGANPYVPVVEKLYRELDYEQALEEISKGTAWGDNTTDDRVWLALMEGVLAIETGDVERGRAAFERGLTLQPDAALPVSAAPRIRELFEATRADVLSRLPPSPAPDPPAVPSEVAEREAPPSNGVAASADESRARDASRPAGRASVTAPAATSGHESGPGLRGIGSARVLVDPVGRSVGGVLDLGAAWRSFEARARWAPGTRQAFGLDLLALWQPGRFGVHAGLRGTAVPAVGAWGGGPLIGARAGLGRNLYVVGDVGAEWYAAPVRFRPFALVVTAGFGVTVGK